MLIVEFNPTLMRLEIQANAKGIKLLRRRLKKSRKDKETVVIGKEELGLATSSSAVAAEGVVISPYKEGTKKAD